MRCRLAAGTAAILALAVVGLAPSPALAQVARDPFVPLVDPSSIPHPAFVGKDTKGTSVAVVFSSLDAAVGYACDGAGTVALWFRGTLDLASGEASLAGAHGASLRYDVRTRSGSLTIEGNVSSFALEPAIGIAGLYRESSTKRHQKRLVGWIVGNDGSLVGQGTINGRVTVAVSGNLDAPTSADPEIPPPASADASTRSFISGVECGILQFRFNFNAGQLRDAQAANDQAAIDDALADYQVIVAKGKRAGCLSFQNL
jgi:hypothetical protein